MLDKAWDHLMDEVDKVEKHGTPEQKKKHWLALESLAQQRVVFVWFNAWQYTGATDVWAGLVVVRS